MAGVPRTDQISREKQGNLTIIIQIGDPNDATLTTPKSSDTLMKISTILSQLQSTNLDNFMLRLRVYGKIDDDWNSQRHLFWLEHKARFKIKTSSTRWILRVSNKDYKINIWHRDWFMFNINESSDGSIYLLNDR